MKIGFARLPGVRGICAALLWVALTSTIAAAQTTPQPPPKTNDNKFGVAMVPHMDGGYFYWDATTKADNTERMLYRIVGEMPEVDRIYIAGDSEQMLQNLMKLKQAGRRLNYLVLAGHGSRETPGFKWGKDEMIPQEVDLEWNQNQLRIANALVKNPAGSHLPPAQIRKRRDELAARVKLLETVGDAMAPDATVLLVNCSAAATDKGQAFVKSFGQVLLGKRGGQIVASRSDISLFEVDWWAKGIGYLIRQWKMPSWNETMVWGDWMTFRIPPADAKRWELVETRIDPEKKNGRHETTDSSGKVIAFNEYAFSPQGLMVRSHRRESDWSAAITWRLPPQLVEKYDMTYEIEMKADAPTKPEVAFRMSASTYPTPLNNDLLIGVQEVWHDGIAHAAFPDMSTAIPGDSRTNPDIGWESKDPRMSSLRAALGHELITRSRAVYVIRSIRSNVTEFNIVLEASGEGLARTPIVIAHYRLAKPGSGGTTASPPKAAPGAATGGQPPPSHTGTPPPSPAPSGTAQPKPSADMDTGGPSGTGAPAGGESRQVPVAFGTWSPTRMEIKGILTTIELKDNLWVVTKLPGPVMEMGSVLMSIDGKSVGGLTPEQIRDLILGPPGSQVEFVFAGRESGRLSRTGYIRR